MQRISLSLSFHFHFSTIDCAPPYYLLITTINKIITHKILINTIEAGQALREDAPDVREKIEKAVQEEPQSQQLPLGIPPSVSYSPDKAATNGDVGNGQHRPDPPEAPGVTGYRQPPLRYSVENGRGGQAPQFSGRGRGGGHPNHIHHPQQQQYHGHPPPNYYGGPPHHMGHYQQHPPHQFLHPHHHPQQLHHPGYNPQPQFTRPQQQDNNNNNNNKQKKSQSDIFAGTAEAAAKAVYQGVDAVTGVANTVTGAVHKAVKRTSGGDNVKNSVQNNDFPLAHSVETNFTMSDISSFHGSTRTYSSATMQISQSGGKNQQQQDDEIIGQGGVHKQSNNSKSSGGGSSTKTNDSFNVSDLMNMNNNMNASNQSLNLPFTFGHSGRTRSFPDFMLSTGDLLPPLHHAEDEGDGSDRDGLDHNMMQEGTSELVEEMEPLKQQVGENSGGGHHHQQQQRIMKSPFNRQTSSSESSNHSMASLTIKGFHPVVRSRANTGMSGIHDAMSIMSIDSSKIGARSETSSWMDNFRSMQSVHSGASLTRGMGDDGSVRSFLSDVSNDLHALDLADPGCLLPPLQLNDSHEFVTGIRPDP